MIAEQTVIVQGLWAVPMFLGIITVLLIWILIGVWRRR